MQVVVTGGDYTTFAVYFIFGWRFQGKARGLRHPFSGKMEGMVDTVFQATKKPRQLGFDTACLCVPFPSSDGGDEGIRTLDTSFGPYAPLAGECLRPLGHISGLPAGFKSSGMHDDSDLPACGQ